MITTLILAVFAMAFYAPLIYLFILLVKALRKYLACDKVPPAEAETFQTLGQTLKAHRTRCGMTQELAAHRLGVSRQAVSKWENGTAVPSTANLLALAKLYETSPEELLKSIT